MDDPEVYVTVTREYLEPEDPETGLPHGGRWFFPHEVYPMRLSEAKRLHDSNPSLGVTWQTADGHHEKSRAEAKRQARELEKAAKAEKGDK